ncbi:hypothetical protein CSUI_002151, partial [Cystoisospora suis]
FDKGRGGTELAASRAEATRCVRVSDVRGRFLTRGKTHAASVKRSCSELLKDTAFPFMSCFTLCHRRFAY